MVKTHNVVLTVTRNKDGEVINQTKLNLDNLDSIKEHVIASFSEVMNKVTLVDQDQDSILLGFNVQVEYLNN